MLDQYTDVWFIANYFEVPYKYGKQVNRMALAQWVTVYEDVENFLYWMHNRNKL